MRVLPSLSVFLCVAIGATGATVALPAKAATQGEVFWDVPANDFAADAVKYLKEKKIISGYEDGSFRPEKKVNRAEALKFIAIQFLSDDEAKKYITSPFSDVDDDAWFLPYVEWARAKNIIQSPPQAKTFAPSRPVTKAEFLKMLLTARGVDPKTFNDIQIALSPDVADPKEWYYPFMRYAIGTSMTTMTTSGVYQPQRDLTRADVAVFLYRFDMYKSGLRTQDLLMEAKKEVENVINYLSAGKLRDAQYASGRGILVTRGALAVKPNETVVKVAVKIAEGCRALTRAYEAAQKGDWKAVVKHSQDAWFLGDQAKKISPDAKAVADQLQKYAKSFADQARGR